MENEKSLWKKTPNEVTVTEQVTVSLGIAAAGVVVVAVTTALVGKVPAVKEKYKKAKANRKAIKAKMNK